MRRRPRKRADDGGFTLIELVMTIVVMGIIFVPLADFFIQYLSSYNQTQQRLSDSHDLQIVAVYFSQDVANTGLRDHAGGQTTFAFAQSVWTSGISTTFCSTAIAGTPILLLKWDDDSAVAGAGGPGTNTGSNAIVSVEYVVNAGTLHRRSCSQPPSGQSTLAPDVTLVHNLSGTPVVTCSTTCTASNPPATITLALSVQSTTSDRSGASLALTGQRRQSSS